MFNLKKSTFLKYSVLVIFIFLLFDNYSYFKNSDNKLEISYNQLKHLIISFNRPTTLNALTNNQINIFNLSSALEPKSSYEDIKCKKSAEIYIKTTLCVHDLNKDIFVSGAIWRDGAWEGHILKPFLDYLDKNPDWLVLDVGAQVGQYSLFAAKMGRDVVCVEPFYDNILRIHKASQLENTTKKITLVKNGLSNKRNEVKRLQPNNGNIGGQSLLDHKNEQYNKTDLEKDKYLIETILFDDLIDYLPKKQNGEEYSKAILKIDIEGFEPYAFQNASKIFDRLDIRIIFMEWGHLPKQIENHGMILEMIRFLRERKYIPMGNNAKLQDSNWKSWTWDIVWIKE